MSITDYISQPNDYTCQSAAIAEALRLTSDADVMKVRSDLQALGEPGDPSVMGEYLKDKVKQYEYCGDASINDITGWLNDGWHLITHTYLTSGHVISIVGLDKDHTDYFVVDDPWAVFDGPSWSYTSDINGNNQLYSKKLIYCAAIAGTSKADAADRYNNNEYKPDVKGAWVHKIKN